MSNLMAFFVRILVRQGHVSGETFCYMVVTHQRLYQIWGIPFLSFGGPEIFKK